LLISLKAQLFPVSCGHTKCIFTGKSSRHLREILSTIDIEIPPDEAYQEAQENALRFLDDIKAEFEKRIDPTSTFECVLLGSVAEGYGIPYTLKKPKISAFISTLRTDLDFMLCFESIGASFSGNGNILIDPIVPKGIGFLGFAQLKSLITGRVISSKDITKQAKNAVSCTNVKNLSKFVPCFGKCEFFMCLSHQTHGPAIKISIPGAFEADITVCIKCFEWPPFSDWPTRKKYWPSLENVHRIKSRGCHLVPKSAPSDKEQTSWRFSFSLAEVELSKLVPKTARKCFLALKIILKDHLQPVDCFTSYQLKTVFLNTLEKTPVNFWVDENIEECFLTLLKELHDALVFRRCPHYWFSSVNLFHEYNNPKQVRSTVRKLQRIAENPAPFLFGDGCCCISPCCVRVHLFDFPEPRRSHENLDDEIIHFDDEPNHPCHNPPSNDAENQRRPLSSIGHKQEPSDVSVQSVIVTIPSTNNDERQPILNHPTCLSKYGSIDI
jgi:hypothetical protein